MSKYYYWADLSEKVQLGIIASRRAGTWGQSTCGCRVESGVEGWELCPYHREMQEEA